MRRKITDDIADEPTNAELAKLHAKLDKLEKQNAELKVTVRKQNKVNKALSDQLETIGKQQFKLKKQGKSKRYRKGSFFRTTSSDIHGYGMDHTAVNAFLADYSDLQPREHIDTGDLVDCGGFLAQHHTLGYVAETNYTYADDLAAGNWFLDEIQKRADKCRITCIAGNHERRVEKWCVTQALRNETDSQLLLKALDPFYQLALESRGIEYIRQGVKYEGLRIPGTIKRGSCYFTHGETASKHEAATMVNRFNGNVVFGHTHRRDSFSKRTVKDGSISAWNPGCLCSIQKFWNHTKLTDWAHGYGLQLVNPDGGFLHINVPIIEGKSYLADLLRLIK